MFAMTRKERKILEDLVRLAGTVTLVEEALRETSRGAHGPVPLERLVRYIRARRGGRAREALGSS
jgi:hypothetical protein